MKAIKRKYKPITRQEINKIKKNQQTIRQKFEEETYDIKDLRMQVLKELPRLTSLLERKIKFNEQTVRDGAAALIEAFKLQRKLPEILQLLYTVSGLYDKEWSEECKACPMRGVVFKIENIVNR